MQQVLVKFEGCWVLLQQVPHALDELEKHRGVVLCSGVSVSTPFVELMPKGEPLLDDELAESLERPVMRVQQELGESNYLAGSVPRIAAVDRDRSFLYV